MTTKMTNPKIILVPGHWLGAWAWDEVVEQLIAMGREAVSLTLPGLDPTDPGRAARTLDEQAAAIEQSLSTDGEATVIVAHSGANAPVSLFVDRHPELVHRVIWVDSGPVTPGTAFAPDFPENTEGLTLPPFNVLGEQASLEGLDTDTLERFRNRAVSEPGPVLRQAVKLSNDAWFEVPATLVCCSIPSAQLRELAAAGHPMFAEVANLKNVDYIDLPTGHWPMWSRQDELARIIADESCQLGATTTDQRS